MPRKEPEFWTKADRRKTRKEILATTKVSQGVEETGKGKTISWRKLENLRYQKDEGAGKAHFSDEEKAGCKNGRRVLAGGTGQRKNNTKKRSDFQMPAENEDPKYAPELGYRPEKTMDLAQSKKEPKTRPGMTQSRKSRTAEGGRQSQGGHSKNGNEGP